MPNACIPIVNGNQDCRLVSKYYANCQIVRLPLDRAADLSKQLGPGVQRWIDPCVDGLQRSTGLTDDYTNYIAGLKNGHRIRKDGLSGQCSDTEVAEFVSDLMSRAMAVLPAWVTIPQLPFLSTPDRGRQKLNKQMAMAVDAWKSRSGASVKLVLPVILCERDVLNKKTEWRNKVIASVKQSLQQCHADSIWVVNSELEDEHGSQPNELLRLPGLVRFHGELLDALQGGYAVLAGPYWAMNVVLWARGLIDRPVIGVATGFKYHISGGIARTANDRIALAPLLRRAEVAGLNTWLQQTQQILLSNVTPAAAVQGMGASFGQAAAEFASLSRQLGRLRGELAREQVAAFYRDWLDRLERTAPSMRALALHQEMSSAHVVGRIVGELPEANTPRDAGRLARQYMLSCL